MFTTRTKQNILVPTILVVIIISSIVVVVIVSEKNDEKNDDKNNSTITNDNTDNPSVTYSDDIEYSGDSENKCILDWVLVNNLLEIHNLPEGAGCVEYNYEQTIVNDGSAIFDMENVDTLSDYIYIYSDTISADNNYCNTDLIETCVLAE